ncbi:MAG: transglutaminase domain-containing protein [Marinobacter sp.]
MLVEAESESVRFIHQVTSPPPGATYPESAFVPRRNRYTEASEDLAAASLECALAAGGGAAGIRALVAEAEARFSYAHPDVRFNDGMDKVPHLSCGLTPGSCVDINTYLVASLRAAGFQAGYMYGYFFRQESGGQTSDMHCWVVTRHEGEILEWDIAHHIKAGLGKTGPGLNPRRGYRIALGHSMGHQYRTMECRTVDLKLLAEPLLRSASGSWDRCPLRIHATDSRTAL